MTRLAFAAMVLVLASCDAVDVIAPSPDAALALVIVNDSDAPVFWSIEESGGERSRFAVEPCSSTSERIALGRSWEVEWGATIAISSDEVQPLEAPVTVIEVRFDSAGMPEVIPPRAAVDQPGAPLVGVTCADD